jgi:hypothetical protein
MVRFGVTDVGSAFAAALDLPSADDFVLSIINICCVTVVDW